MKMTVSWKETVNKIRCYQNDNYLASTTATAPHSLEYAKSKEKKSKEANYTNNEAYSTNNGS
jgi:hypothetical protein